MLIGFKARNHPQSIAALGVDDSVDDRRTPDGLFRELHSVHRFTVDAAASDANAQLPKYWTREIDGLAQSWRGERVWCNPPFSDCGTWVARAWDAMVEGCSLVVMLLPANRTDQTWWQDLVEPYRDGGAERSGAQLRVRFLGARRRFGRPEGAPKTKKGDRPPFGVCLLVWQPKT